MKAPSRESQTNSWKHHQGSRWKQMMVEIKGGILLTKLQTSWCLAIYFDHQFQSSHLFLFLVVMVCPSCTDSEGLKANAQFQKTLAAMALPHTISACQGFHGVFSAPLSDCAIRHEIASLPGTAVAVGHSKAWTNNKTHLRTIIWMFPKLGVPQNGWWK